MINWSFGFAVGIVVGYWIYIQVPKLYAEAKGLWKRRKPDCLKCTAFVQCGIYKQANIGSEKLAKRCICYSVR